MTDAALSRAADAPRPMTPQERRVVLAASAGAVFEWYDFFLYGSLTPVIAQNFFSNVHPTAAYIFALLAFAAGFAVRPFGALLFGRLGDLSGRKFTFLLTILIMGLSTFFIGLLPNFAAIGFAAPVLLTLLRMAQGLALGGEYGGAALFVGESAPHGRRGYYTSFIQLTASGGLLLALLVTLGFRALVGEEDFALYGWRFPFLASFLLLAASVWMRLRLNESPAYQRIKRAGRASAAPIAEAFGVWRHGRLALLALFGATAGQAVVWYTGQFYALFFLTQTLRLDSTTASLLMAGALALAAPLFTIFGALSDRIGRKPVILGGCLLAAALYFPIFHGLAQAVNPALAQATARAPARVIADPKNCDFQFDPVEAKAFVSSCDIAKNFLASAGVSYANVAAAPGTLAKIAIGDREIASFEGTGLNEAARAAQRAALERQVGDALAAAGYPARADPAKVNVLATLALLTALIGLVAMTYGPIAALLVELFPTRIRYTALSTPYHIGNGWFGGLLPPLAFALTAASGDIYSGLWYPVAVAALTFVVGLAFLPETRNRDITAGD
ncbi:Predicted arabinose efflux permease, MFS family [Rhodoblastus acidophilus]|uniref:Predicted arabinose efflux permease, MFS family n=2 Tax=Rhodoblastus acidophilus TaxID=1074 RepID=A0A212R898_RHOAC|nr:MFS transporter [Rhodoblastus acidophilus]PPQ37941.1 MFS transporter [Rhodoblastus acidophilus]RAI24050.1 MFS transporter [Rhodoblastus acidophilus]SNB68382.1 Predicted arabinose efflux permease, MFS family [Rhodoblastus acidophilus]